MTKFDFQEAEKACDAYRKIEDFISRRAVRKLNCDGRLGQSEEQYWECIWVHVGAVDATCIIQISEDVGDSIAIEDERIVFDRKTLELDDDEFEAWLAANQPKKETVE